MKFKMKPIHQRYNDTQFLEWKELMYRYSRFGKAHKRAKYNLRRARKLELAQKNLELHRNEWENIFVQWSEFMTPTGLRQEESWDFLATEYGVAMKSKFSIVEFNFLSGEMVIEFNNGKPIFVNPSLGFGWERNWFKIQGVPASWHPLEVIGKIIGPDSDYFLVYDYSCKSGVVAKWLILEPPYVTRIARMVRMSENILALKRGFSGPREEI